MKDTDGNEVDATKCPTCGKSMVTADHSDLAGWIVNTIKNDILDRKGLRQVWEEIDPLTQKEIIDIWIAKVYSELRIKL